MSIDEKAQLEDHRQSCDANYHQLSMDFMKPLNFQPFHEPSLSVHSNIHPEEQMATTANKANTNSNVQSPTDRSKETLDDETATQSMAFKTLLQLTRLPHNQFHSYDVQQEKNSIYLV